MSEEISIKLAKDRRFPVGAERILEKGIHFRVWAPERKTVKLVMDFQGEQSDPLNQPIEVELQREGNGYFSVILQDTYVGTLYLSLIHI